MAGERSTGEFDHAICTYLSASFVATMDLFYQSGSSEGYTITYLARSYAGSVSISTSNMNQTACGL